MPETPRPRSLNALFLTLVLLISACAAPPESARAEPATAPAASQPAEKDFIPLFNGKDLPGWTYASKVGKGYQVDESTGVVYCTETDGGRLYTDKEYSDFVLRFDVKLSPNGNNGIAIRAPFEGNSAYQGMEIQVLDNDGSKYQSLRPAQYHGSIYDVVPAKRGFQKPVGQWNEEEIIAVGRRIKVKLNGTTIVDADLDDVKDPAVLKKHPGLANKSGHIGFLGHGTRIEFRNMRIKDLSGGGAQEKQASSH